MVRENSLINRKEEEWLGEVPAIKFNLRKFVKENKKWVKRKKIKDPQVQAII